MIQTHLLSWTDKSHFCIALTFFSFPKMLLAYADFPNESYLADTNDS